jgi:hypothetical protein
MTAWPYAESAAKQAPERAASALAETWWVLCRSRVPALQAGENAGGFCQNHKHLPGVLNGHRVRVFLSPCYGRSRNQPYARIDGTQVDERPELIPAHHSTAMALYRSQIGY